jgi:hypothetical protein
MVSKRVFAERMVERVGQVCSPATDEIWIMRRTNIG